MPIYVYRCTDCHQEHEALQKVSDSPLMDCPHCGAPKLQKQLTAAAFQLKGTGWYVTDFKGNAAGETQEKKEGKDSENAAKAQSEKNAEGSEGSEGSDKASDGKNTNTASTEKANAPAEKTTKKNESPPTSSTTKSVENTKGSTTSRTDS